MGSAYNDDRDDWTRSGEKRVSGAVAPSYRRHALTKRLHRKQMAPFFSKLPRCLIAMEACGTAHFWARTLAATGHGARFIPPSYVKAYVKRGKSDALDAEAICEAVQRPTMRFVPVKTIEQQSIIMAHRARSLLVRRRTMLANALRAHLAERGLVANPGIANLAKLAQQALSDENGLPSYACTTLEAPGPADNDAFRADHGARSQAPRVACRK